MSFILTLYGPYLLNLFIKTSTWFVVTLALYRHAAILRPVSGKRYLTTANTLISITICFVFWILLLLPLTWSWEARPVACFNKSAFIMLDIGVFEKDVVLRQTFTHLWTAVGFLLPVCILAYCNVNMILSLRTRSSLRRSSSTSGIRSSQRHHRLIAQRRMTITLITIVASFFLLVFPSELIHYYLDLFHKRAMERGTLVNSIVTCNTLQAINMSNNFVLYCVVNSNFRKTLMNMIPRFRSQDKNNEAYNTVPAITGSVVCTDM